MAEQVARKIRTALAVDDEEYVLRGYARLVRQGLELFAARDAEAALKIAAAQQPDLAIVDLNLGAQNGLTLIPELKRVSPATLVIMVSGFASIEAAVHAMRVGAHDVICKPVSLTEIIRRATAARRDVPEPATPSLERAQWEHVQRVLADCDGNVSRTARELGVYRTTLRRWLRRSAPTT
jgi:two-component system, response regulator RegA